MNILYYVRHGENPANITKELSCRLVDYELTEKGILQARQTADYFKDKKIDQIYSSPLKRAYQTASYIASELNTTYSIVEDLRELNVGDLERLKPDKSTWDAYFRVIEHWKSGNYEVAFPGGENFLTLLERMKQVLRTLFTGKKNKHIIAVAHGGIIGYTIHDLCSSIAKNVNPHADNHNCAISTFEITIENDELFCRLLDWGNHSHLDEKAGSFAKTYPEFNNDE